MDYSSAGGVAPSALARTPLNRQQILGFWAAWFGWMLDGMDSVIYALVLSFGSPEVSKDKTQWFAIDNSPTGCGKVCASAWAQSDQGSRNETIGR
jgi:hypothetical protein